MQNPIRIYIFRHGQTDWNREGRIQGHIDIPLNELGREQARKLIRPFQRLRPELILSSHLSRARETGEIIARSISVPLHEDERLREIFLGKLQGLTKTEIAEQHGDIFSGKLRHEPLSDADIVALGSESGAAVVERATRSVMECFQKTGACNMAVSTHGGVVRHLLQVGSPAGTFPPPAPNGLIYPLELDLKSLKWRSLGFLEISPDFP